MTANGHTLFQSESFLSATKRASFSSTLANFSDAGYFPRAALFNKVLSNFTIERSDGIIQQLSGQGVKPTDLKAVILSHLHNEHSGGLGDLIATAPDLPVYVSYEHWKAFGEHPFFAGMEGATPNHWPKKFAPKITNYQDGRVESWEKSYPLISDGKMSL